MTKHDSQPTLRAFAFAALTAVVLASTATMLLPIQSAQAQASGWSQPLQIAPENISSWFPDVKVDSSGLAHVVFAGSGVETGSDQYYDMVKYVALRDGQIVNPAVDIMATEATSTGSYAARPRLWPGRNGIMNMTWRDIEGVKFTQAPVTKAGVPIAWTDSKLISEGYFSQIVEDSRSRLHLLVTENVVTAECMNCFHLYYYQSDNDGESWTPQKDISVLTTGAAKPDIAIDVNNNLYVVWEMGPGGDLGQLSRPSKIAYAASYDRGETWTTPTTFVPGGANTEARQPSIIIDGRGNLLMTWMSVTDPGFYYQVSSDQGKNWSSPQRIPAIFNAFDIYDNRLDGQSMAQDSAGTVHLAVVGRTLQDQKTLNLLRLEWNGAAWSAPDVVATIDPAQTGDVPQWPRIAVGLGNQLHMVWYLRRGALKQELADNPPPYEIFYTTARSNAQALPPQPVPEVRPTATPKGRTLPQIVPTDMISLTQAERGLPNSDITLTRLQSENDGYVRLGLSLVPALAIIIGVILFTRFKRR